MPSSVPFLSKTDVPARGVRVTESATVIPDGVVYARTEKKKETQSKHTVRLALRKVIISGLGTVHLYERVLTNVCINPEGKIYYMKSYVLFV